MNRQTIEQCERIIRDVCAGRSCLDTCIARIRAAGRCRACRPPAPAARPRNALKIVAALGALVALAALSLLAEVVCEWNGQAYVCSGFGEEIIVKPGDPNNIGQEIVTNYYGCCTNCTAIAPDVLSNLLMVARGYANQARDLAGDLYGDLYYMSEQVDNKLDEISGYQNSGYFEDQTGVSDKWASISNYLLTVDNDQTRVVRTGTGFPTGGGTYKARWLSANDAIYLYANNSEVPQLNDTKRSIDDSITPKVRDIENASAFVVDTIDEILPQLAKAPDCSSLSNGCSGVAGRWCTEEQGDAIINLLREQVDYLLSISNYLHSVDLHLGGLYRTFMSLRGGIPAEESLDNTWQDIYLSNTTGSFAYGYTNVMERIELLLYGLSGVGTNDTGFTSAENPFDEGEDTAQNEYDRTMEKFEDVENSYELGGVRMQSLWDRLVLFFNAFQHLVGQALEPNTGLVGSFSFQLSTNDFDVPSLTTGQEVGFANTLQSICRVGMSALYWIFAGVVGIKFYMWFFSKVLFFLKWAWELLHGLFS